MQDTCADHCKFLVNLLRENINILNDNDKRCLKQLLLCVQQLDLDALAEPDNWHATTKTEPRARHRRIIATVQPYSNSTIPSSPTTSCKQVHGIGGSSSSTRQNSGSLSESGVFVECDLISATAEPEQHPHLQYYQERLIQLEGKLQVYESSGEKQAKLLAERLQREIQLKKQVKELIERVDFLVEQNAILDEAKCEFEEAENDTRLHLQRNEEELEILQQRNVELGFGKDALTAKYRDCRAECLILREDLNTAKTQLESLQAERQRIDQHLHCLKRTLPLFLIYHLFRLTKTKFDSCMMGNEESLPHRTPAGACKPAGSDKIRKCSCSKNANAPQDSAAAGEINCLKEEIKTLRCSLKELNTRHYEAMETADSHWVELEREYKMREEGYRTKEICLKKKINKLQDCLRDDSRAASEKIQQLEEAEHGLKTCLLRLTKEHRDLMEHNQCLERESENRTAAERQACDQLQPLTDELESEKRRSQALADDLCFAQKLQQSMEEQLKAETDCLRQQIYDLKKELMNAEVTNCELKEEVSTLESKINQLEEQLKTCAEHCCCLEDELRTKDELVHKLEKKLGVCPEGFSLADELYDSPEKRAKREEIRNLEAASQGLGCALRDLERRERELPTHKDFQTIACSVKQLADTILHAQKSPVSECDCEDTTEPGPSMCQAFELLKGSEKSTIPEIDKEKSPRESVREQIVKKDSVPKEESIEEADNTEARTSGGGISSRTAGGGVSEGELISLKHIRHQLKSRDCKACPKLGRLVYGRQLPHDQRRPPMKNKTRLTAEHKKLNHNRRQCKRFVSRCLHRGRVRRSGATVRFISMNLPRNFSVSTFHSAVSVQTAHTEPLLPTSQIHYITVVDSHWDQFQLSSIVQTEPIDCQNQFVQTIALMCDEQQQTELKTSECATQAENIGVESRLQLLPGRTRAFLLLLQDCIKSNNNSFGVDVFRARVLKLWEESEEFREHIELLQDLCIEQRCPQNSNDLHESYDVFVAVLGCVRALKFALKPSDSSFLLQLEDRINKRLISFHNHEMESKFYCTIFYPVERQNTLKFGEEM